MRAVIAHPYGGKLVMTGFPGLETDMEGNAVFMPDKCLETLTGLYAEGARVLHVLVEPDELDRAGFDLLERTAARVGIALNHHPIVDYAVPSDALAQAWRNARTGRDALLQAGGTLAFSCQYGAGRSGLMAAWTLIEAGLSPDAAMAHVRAQFPEAVESDAQEAWLRALQAP